MLTPEAKQAIVRLRYVEGILLSVRWALSLLRYSAPCGWRPDVPEQRQETRRRHGGFLGRSDLPATGADGQADELAILGAAATAD